MRIALAFAWLRWRLIANSLRGGRRRDTVEDVSRVLHLMVPLASAALSVGLFILMALLGYVSGRSMAAAASTSGSLAVRMTLAVMMLPVIAFAVSSPAQSSLTRYTRLLLLPIARRSLHLVEVGAALVDPWILLFVPGLAGGVVGLAVGGRLGTAATALAAGVLLVALLACLASAIAFAAAWLLRSRRRSELFTLGFVLALSLVSILPAFFSRQRVDRNGDEPSRARVERDVSRLLIWTRGVPTELYTRTIRASLDGRPGEAGVTIMLLAGELSALFALSSAVHARLVGSVEGRGRRRRAGANAGLTPAVPLVGPVVSAVAAAQYRTGIRSVRGRLIVLLPGPMLAIMALAFRAISDDPAWVVTAMAHGHLLFGAGVFFSIYTMQAFSMNLFGSDRAGLTQQFLAPISDVDLAHGKLVGVALLLGATVGLCLISALVVSRSGSPALWLAALVGGVSTYLLMTPFMVWFSAVFPVAADLSKTGNGGNPHTVSMIAGMLLSGVAAAPAVAILVLAEFWLARPWLGLLLMTLWAGLCLALSAPCVTFAAQAVGRRRENLALVAQGR